MEHELLNLQKGHFLNQEVVEATDVQHYQEKAKKIVEEAQKIRQAGNKVTYADFSKSVNDQLRVYNATMRISRLEMLKSQIGLEMVQSGIDVDKALHDKLSQDYIDEVKRQAGILGVTAKPSMWTDKNVAKIIMGQTESANFSQRLWANQAALKAQLDQVISTGIIQGQNPREMATKLKANVAKTITNYRYVTERLARTESARVQHRAQIDSLIANDYRFCKWHAEPGRCKFCGEIASNDPDGNGRGIYEVDDVPIVPVHPCCRCSISAYWVNGQRNIALSDDEQAALNNYISSDSYKINDDLRRNKISKNKKQFIENLDAALAKMPIYHSSKPLQRDYFFDKQEALDDFISNFEIGGLFTDSSYISTSKIYYGQGKETIHVIIKSSKTGRDISEFNFNEQEVLFPRNSKFRIDDAYVDDNGKMTMVWSELDE